MIWIAPSGKETDAALEKRLWDAAEQAVPAPHFAETDFNGGRPQGLLGIIFLRSAEVRFTAQRAKLDKVAASPRRGSRLDAPVAYHTEPRGVSAVEGRDSGFSSGAGIDPSPLIPFPGRGGEGERLRHSRSALPPVGLVKIIGQNHQFLGVNNAIASMLAARYLLGESVTTTSSGSARGSRGSKLSGRPSRLS